MSRLARAKDNRWTKFFIDGTKLEGFDRDVPTRRCSWSRSQLHSLSGVRIDHDGISIEINGPGEYHQSDTLEVSMRFDKASDPKWDARRVQRKIQPDDFSLIICKSRHRLYTEVNNFKSDNSILGNKNEEIFLFTEEEVGQWLTVELEADKLISKWYISKERI